MHRSLAGFCAMLLLAGCSFVVTVDDASYRVSVRPLAPEATVTPLPTVGPSATATVAPTSTPTVTATLPPATPALWAVVQEGPDCPDWVQPTGAHDAYNIGDCVTFEGQQYVSKINANVWSPAVYPAGWELQ